MAALYYQLCFCLLMMQITYVVLLLLPIRKVRQLLVIFGKSTLFNQLVHYAHITCPFILILVVDSAYKMMRVYDSNEKKPSMKTLLESRLFGAQRNLYLTLFILLLGACIFQLHWLIEKMEIVDQEKQELQEDENEEIEDMDALQIALDHEKSKVEGLKDDYQISLSKLQALDELNRATQQIEKEKSRLNSEYTELQEKYNALTCSVDAQAA